MWGFYIPKVGNWFSMCGNFSKYLAGFWLKRAWLEFCLYIENQSIMIYVALFILIVAVIAVVTHRLNAVAPCDHKWEAHDNSFKCCKCGKKIPDYTVENNDAYRRSLTEAA